MPFNPIYLLLEKSFEEHPLKKKYHYIFALTLHLMTEQIILTRTQVRKK